MRIAGLTLIIISVTYISNVFVLDLAIAIFMLVAGSMMFVVRDK